MSYALCSNKAHTLGGTVQTPFEQFITERRYLMNVSPATISWYQCAFKWLPCADPTQEDLNQMVIRMREHGLRPTGCNAVSRACNAYLKWRGSTCHIKPMREPEFIPPTFSEEQVRKLINWTPHRFFERRLHLLILILLDTGARISEATGLKVSDVDLGDMLFTLSGKGRKQRRVPFSLELRKALYRYTRDFEPKGYLLEGTQGQQLGRGTALHDVKRLCRRLGFEPPVRTLHSFRHTFAVNYLRKGGGTFHLQKSLGHTSLEMSRRYANLMTEDLSAVHSKVSLLVG